MNEAGNIASRGLITITYCNNVSYCIKFKKKETTLLGFRQSGSTPQVSSIVPGQECEQLGYYTVCSTVWIYDYSNPGDPFGGGGGGENGGGGGGSGGGSGDNGGGSGGWQDPIGPLPCDENGQPANSFENPCNQGGWVPVFDPNKVDIDPSIYLKPAEFNGNRTYVTPGGVPFTLPAGSRIRYYQNIDVNIFPNGALYAFDVPVPDTNLFETYVAYQKAYLTPGALIVPRPEYNGYYKVENGQIDFTKPYPTTNFVTPQPNSDNIVKTVKVSVEKNVNGTCKIVRSISDYSPAANLPANAGTTDFVNYDIEYSPAAAQSPTESTPITFCPGDASPSGNPTMTITEFAAIYGPAIKEFLNRLDLNVKIYLYDCSSNLSNGHTISKSSVSPLSPSQLNTAISNFDNQNVALGSNDEDIAIKACISNGKWTTDVKLNYTRMGQVHSKFQNIQQSIVAEFKQLLQKELAPLQGVGKVAAEQRFILSNGEEFYIAQMGFFEKAASLCEGFVHIMKNGALPEKYWDSGARATSTDLTKHQNHQKSPFGIPPIAAGGIDELIGDFAGPVILVKTAIEHLSRPAETFNNLKKAVTELSWSKVRSMISGVTGADNYNAGGDLAKYQAGQHTMMAATIWFGGISASQNGKKMVKDGSNGVNDIQRFIPEGSAATQVTDVIKNAHANQKAIKNIDNEKLLTQNVINGENYVAVVTKNGEKIYSGKVNYDINGVGDDVLKKADAEDFIEMHTDPAINNQVKTRPQQFKDGKDFERNVTNDPTHTEKVQTAAGVNLTGFSKVNQVQIKLPNGGYMVADDMWYKEVAPNRYEVVINESKLSSTAPFTTNQNTLLTELANGNSGFELRNVKFASEAVSLPQGSILEIKAFVKTVGDGTSGINNYTITKIP